jgi:hypothetical protein
MAFISVSTLLPAAGEYLRPDDFLAPLFFGVLIFFAAFFVAISSLLRP